MYVLVQITASKQQQLRCKLLIEKINLNQSKAPLELCQPLATVVRAVVAQLASYLVHRGCGTQQTEHESYMYNGTREIQQLGEQQ